MTEKEYNVCVEEYSDRVFAYLVKNMQDSDSAKDVLQDSFVSLWNNRQKVEKEKSKSFLFTVAHNLMMNTFNYNKLRQQPIILEELMENRDFEKGRVPSHRLPRRCGGEPSGGHRTGRRRDVSCP